MRSSVSVILSTPTPETNMSHPDYEQCAHDHGSLLVLIKSIGSEVKPSAFNRLFDRISRLNKLKISDSTGTPRDISVRYVKDYPVENNDWGDFQTHRRLLGLISIGKCSTQLEFNEVCRTHESIKVKYLSTLYDSKCILLGMDDELRPVTPNGQQAEPFALPTNFKTRALFYTDLEACVNLESHISEFISALFWILESKRQERSREKIDKVSLLLAPFEKKDFVGLDLESRTNKKRCVGRMTKHLGDLTLQCGLMSEALGFYQTATEVLRGINDWLWLGASLEGFAAASAIVLYPHLSRSYSFQRNSSLQDGTPVKGRSASITTNSLPNGAVPLVTEQFKGIQNCLSVSDIPKYYREAILHYSKYQNAGIVETEACFKGARISIEQGVVLNAATVLQNVVFINLQLSENEKILRFTTLADLYRQIGFMRKAAFCSRLAATRFVSLQNPTPDWNQCYHHMLQAISGHKLSLDPTEFPADGLMGWATLQIQLLQELVVAARRMNHPALATRHMTFLIQTLWSQLAPAEQSEFALQLQSLSAQCEGAPVPLVLESGVVIPPANLTNIPQARMFHVENLTPHLRPQKIEKLKEDSGPFLFTPINFGSLDRRNLKSGGKVDHLWVEGDICEVNVKFFNPLPFELQVSDVRLLSTGVVFESIPTSIAIPPDSTVQCTLTGIPKEVGDLEILGYSTHTLGVKSNCRLKYVRGFTCQQYTVEVIPSICRISVSTSLTSTISSSTLGDSAHIVTSGSITLYAGESSKCTISLHNKSEQPLEMVEVSMQSILDPDIQQQTFRWSKEDLSMQLPVKCNDSATFSLAINAISDFLSLPHDDGSYLGGMGSQPTSLLGSGLTSLPSQLGSPSLTRKQPGGRAMTDGGSLSFRSAASTRSGNSARLPASPLSRLALPCVSKNVEAQLKLKYSGGPGLEAGYCRMCAVYLNLEILPSIHITGWDVLPAETSEQFYLVLDIANMTNYELELLYTADKRILMDASEPCRVPIPLPRCPLSKLPSNAGEEVSIESQLEIERICSDHIVSLVDLKWSIPATGNSGRASLSGLSLSFDMLEIVMISRLQWNITVNSHGIKPQEELSHQVGDCLNLGVNISNLSDQPLRSVALVLYCYQDYRNGTTNHRMDTRFAFSGTDRTLITVIEEQKSIFHEFNLVFFHTGQFKIGMMCTPQDYLQSLANDDNMTSSSAVGQSWQLIPPIDITIIH